MKIKKGLLFFYIYYFFLYVSLFIDDIALEGNVSDMASKILKVTAGIFLIIKIIKTIKFSDKKQIVVMMLKAIPFLVLFVASRDFFWLLILLAAFGLDGVSDEQLFKTSRIYLLAFTSLVLVLHFTGLLPDVMTQRHVNSTVRHSFGFYHSNVLPIALYYVFAYLIAEKKFNISNVTIAVFLAATMLLYYFCNSKNALISSLILLITYIIFKKIKSKKDKNSKFIDLLSKNSIFICVIASMIPAILRAKSLFVSVWNFLDRIVTNRIYLSARQFNITGLHFVNAVNSETYFSNSFTVDNAYVYMTLRYGILAVIIFILINYYFIKKHKNSSLMKVMFILIAICNIVDNDLFSYGFLPFLMIALCEMFKGSSTKELKHIE